MTHYLDLIMFVALMACILLGYPVAFTIAGTAVVFAYLGWILGVMDISLLGALGQRVFGVLTNDILIAIPLFIFMGAVLQKSKIAEELLETMGQLFGQLRGGLGISVVLVGALLAASTGIVGATVVAMGMIALPAMLRSGYNPKLASGIVCTAGTLGQIIPPSTLLIILSDVMSNAYQQSQYAQGKFTIETISVGQVFAAALMPGLLLVAIYILYIVLRGMIRPNDAPPASIDIVRPDMKKVMSAILPPVLLIISVLGAILGGIASPTEAASVGAIGAILMAGLREEGKQKWIVSGVISLLLLVVFTQILPVNLRRNDFTSIDLALGVFYIGLSILGCIAIIISVLHLYRKTLIHDALTSTLTMSAMIFATIIAAGMFSLVFIGLGGEERVADILASMPGGALGALIFSMLFIFILGFFLDFVEISVIVLPLVVPALITMGHDPIWLAVLIAINLQTSFLTPPFGFSLFYLRGVAPKSISTLQIYLGVAPFIALQIFAVSLIYFWPEIATYLPRNLF